MKMYAIRYGRNFKYGTVGTVFRNSPKGDELLNHFSFFYYVIQFEHKNFLVDTGFRDRTLAENMGVVLIPVEKEVEAVLGGMEIDTIFLTHSHWDHINNLDLYKPRQIIMAKTAYEMAMESGTKEVIRSLSENNVVLVEQKQLVEDRFLFRIIGGHTPDSSAIFFEAAGQNYVITGDECYVQDNVNLNIPIGISENAEKNEEFVRFCHEKKYVPLPFHDGEIMEKYERISENVVRII